MIYNPFKSRPEPSVARAAATAAAIARSNANRLVRDLLSAAIEEQNSTLDFEDVIRHFFGSSVLDESSQAVVRNGAILQTSQTLMHGDQARHEHPKLSARGLVNGQWAAQREAQRRREAVARLGVQMKAAMSNDAAVSAYAEQGVEFARSVGARMDSLQALSLFLKRLDLEPGVEISVRTQALVRLGAQEIEQAALSAATRGLQ